MENKRTGRDNQVAGGENKSVVRLEVGDIHVELKIKSEKFKV